MIVTSRRAIAAGVWAAVMLALAVTGPQWAFTPWFAVPALALLAGLGLYALGLFDAHHAAADGSTRGIRTTRRERKKRISASEAASQEAWDAMLAGYRPLAIEAAPAREHSATWGEPPTGVVDYGDDGDIPDHDALCECADCLELDRYQESRRAQVVVTGGTAGRHARDRVHAFTPGKAITRCEHENCQRQSHSTADHDRWAAMAAAAGPPRTPAQKADTSPGSERLPDYIAAYLEEGGFTGHATRAALYESAWTKGMSRAVAAIEAAKS
jgi:hypothetical protein